MSTLSVLATFVDPTGGSRIDATFASGFDVTFDTPDSGTQRVAASPTETLLGALAACTSLDVVGILRKKRQAVSSYQIAVSGEKSDEHPKVFTTIVVEHRVSGMVEPEALRRSIELSATRYCPVSAMLSASVQIEHRYRLRNEADGGDEQAALVVVTGPGRVSEVDQAGA